MTTHHRCSRRQWLQQVAIGSGASALASWRQVLSAAALPDAGRSKSVILLWMNGGPATIDLWDLKPGNVNGGPSRETATALPGMRISENLPKLASLAGELVLIRSMTSREGEHSRAVQFVHTGYSPQGAIQFPTLGSLVASEIGRRNMPLPGFLSIAPARSGSPTDGGFLGPRFAPLTIEESESTASPLRVPDLKDLAAGTASDRTDRLSLQRQLDDRFSRGRCGSVVDSLRAATTGALQLMAPDTAMAFRLEDERPKTRDRYGKNPFASGCLLARRLVERGAAFVEVALDGWDTHENNFTRVPALAATLDNAFAALLTDLRERGLLESTLVVCIGEFGRTPKINQNRGRDHWPHAWSAVLAGGGLKGGQIVGKTTADGTDVADRPVRIPDLIATICQCLGIDPTKQNPSNVGRPIRIADPSAKIIEGLL